MPQMNGVEFLEAARAIFPEARRALLTAYADTEAAIRAINGAKIDYYLMKPWEPLHERLYPIIDDLLDEWQGKALSKSGKRHCCHPEYLMARGQCYPKERQSQRACWAETQHYYAIRVHLSAGPDRPRPQ